MKTKISILFVALTFILYGFAQTPKNLKSETKTVVTTIKDSKGEKKIVKTEDVREIQKIELVQEKPNTINVPQVPSPVDVVKTTKLTIDGNVKSLDVAHSSYYNLNGKKYLIQNDKQGYTLTSSDNTSKGILRRTSNNNNFYINDDKVAVGYYDADGNFILETYDAKTDSIITEKFEIIN
mgnify:CR=1 FL=1